MEFVVDIKKAAQDKKLLGEYGNELSTLANAKVNIPNGFIITTEAYYEFIKANKFQQKIKHLITSHDKESLETVAKHIRRNFLKGDTPDEILLSIFNSYRRFGWMDTNVILIPSLTDPHLKLRTKIGIKGEAVLLEDIKNIWASYFDHELLSHRENLSLNHFKTGIAIVVLEELKPQKAGTIEESKVTVSLGSKITEKEEADLLKIEEAVIEHHYFSKKINWIVSGEKVYVTGISSIPGRVEVAPKLITPEKVIEKKEEPEVEHVPVNHGAGRIVTGTIKIVTNKKDMDRIKYGDIVVLPSIKNYDELKALKHAKAAVVENEITNQHIKMVLSQMGLPIIMANPRNLKDGMIATADATKNLVYEGEFKV